MGMLEGKQERFSSSKCAQLFLLLVVVILLERHETLRPLVVAIRRDTGRWLVTFV